MTGTQIKQVLAERLDVWLNLFQDLLQEDAKVGLAGHMFPLKTIRFIRDPLHNPLTQRFSSN